MQRLVKYERELLTGLQPSRGPDTIDFWEDGENIIFQDGAVQPAPGQYLILPKAEDAPIIGILEMYLESVGKKVLLFGLPAKIYCWFEDYASPDQLTAGLLGIEDATATQKATQWSMVSWGEQAYLTNGVDEPRIWAASAPLITVASSFFTDKPPEWRAEIFGKIGPYLLAFNTVDVVAPGPPPVTESYPTRIEWCDTDDPFTWTPSISNAAGNLQIRDLGSPIIAAKPFSNGYAVYGINSCHYVSFVGAPDYFGVRPLLSGIGAVGKNAVVSVDRLQYGFGSRGIWMHDGSQAVYIDTPDIHDYIYSDLNQNQSSKFLAATDSNEQLVLFFWASANQNKINRGAAYNRSTKTWTKLSYGRTSYSPGDAWPGSITGAANGDVWLHSGIGFAPPSEGQPVALTAILLEIIVPGYGKSGYGMGYYAGYGQNEEG